MAVPNTNTFSLRDVKTEIESKGGGTVNSLVEAFSRANSSGFNTSYVGVKDRLSNFRGYVHSIPDANVIFWSNIGPINYTLKNTQNVKCSIENSPYGTSASGVNLNYYSEAGINVGTQLYFTAYGEYRRYDGSGNFALGNTTTVKDYVIVEVLTGLIVSITDPNTLPACP